MDSARRSITTLLIGAGGLFLGYGIIVTLIPIRAQIEGFSTTWIGLMGTAQFAGFAVGCLVGPAAVLIHPLAVDPISWSVLRGITGLCLAVLYMVVESWLNDQASNEVRGQVLSIYIIVTNVVTMGGQLAVNLYDPSEPALFILTAIAICLALVPIALTDAPAPRPIASAKLRIAALFRLSPTAFIGCIAIGAVDSAFWTLGPVFAQTRALGVSEVTLFMAAFLVGGTISQWPLGRLSDLLDRRIIIAFCCLGTVGTGLALALWQPEGRLIPFALACLHGGFMIPLYALLLAHANDYAPSEALVETSSGLLLLYAIGAVTGPLVFGTVMEATEPGSLFLIMAGILGLLALYILYRMLRRPLGKALDRVIFVPVPKTSPSVYELETDD